MDQLWAQEEGQIQPLRAGMFCVVIGSYTGNDDLTIDKAAADAEIAKLFPNRWKESCTENVSAKTATLSGGAFDAAITPYVYRDDVLCAESEYTFVAGTGVFTFTTLGAGEVITVTLVKNIFGANLFEPDSSFPNTVKDIKAFGAIDPVYSTTEYQDTEHTIKVSGTFDISSLRRTYPTADLEKAIYGAQWDATSDVENTPARNTNPFFVAGIWWYPDATSGQVQVKKLIYYKCTLNKAVIPIPDGTDNAAKFEIDAVSLYNRTVNTLVS
jgi:hypothetical protein